MFRNTDENKTENGLFAVSFKPENFIPGVIIGFLFGLFYDLSKPAGSGLRRRNFLPGKKSEQCLLPSNNDRELKLVLVVRQDLKMGTGKIASQCARATWVSVSVSCSDRYLLRRWEQCGQPKIVCTCRKNRLREAAENIGLATFVVADAGRTQVEAGSKTVLAVGPGPKELVDTVTGKLRLL
ncbi:hypothetical protein SAY86_031293 [Trapa natans]|uniref:peptidyl-tRNA hydrolase n=1 Tax=Trapa natans TaxID=22666 RepID=A0AAN7R7A4_TRANT|nr:hypothetical protein SAY86_031293 [Trapa natans]